MFSKGILTNVGKIRSDSRRQLSACLKCESSRLTACLFDVVDMHLFSLENIEIRSYWERDIERSELKLLQRQEDTHRNKVCKFKLYYSSKFRVLRSTKICMGMGTPIYKLTEGNKNKGK